MLLKAMKVCIAVVEEDELDESVPFRVCCSSWQVKEESSGTLNAREENDA